MQAYKACHEKRNQPWHLLDLAESLAKAGYSVLIRESAVGSNSNTDCLRNLRHAFLCVTDPSFPCATEEVIVEPCLKDHFLIAHPTPTFTNVLASLPHEFVGSKAALAAVVNIVCAEMMRSFKDQSHVVPPWRQMGSMMSKWFPNTAKDTALVASSGRP